MGTVIFNGVSTVDLGIIVQTPPTYQYPEKDMTLTHIPGRNGDIATHNGCYKNVERSYYFASIFRKGTGFIENAQELIAWLHSADGYARLEDSYDPEVYRLALYKESQELTNILDQVTAVQAIFECKPQRFLKEGEKPIACEMTIDEGTGELKQYVIENPTNQISLPKITISTDYEEIETDGYLEVEFVHESGESWIVKYSFTEGDIPKYMIFDSEYENCYKLSESEEIQILINRSVELTNGFPKLKPGKTTMSYHFSNIPEESTLGEIQIIPRWWKL